MNNFNLCVGVSSSNLVHGWYNFAKVQADLKKKSWAVLEVTIVFRMKNYIGFQEKIGPF